MLKPAQAIQIAAARVANLLDGLGTQLSGLPASPFSDFLVGAVWLVRRNLLPVGSGVGLWGAASCVASKNCSGQNLKGADLAKKDLTDVDFSKADLTAANLTDSKLIRTDLTAANLTEADLNRAVMAYTQTTGTVWNNTTCPNGSKSSTGCGGSPGLISSDWLRVDQETGEWNGDEPVLVSVVVQTTLGTAGSTSVQIVPENPHELGSGVKVGRTVGIPNSTGDLLLNSVKPLSLTDLVNAAEKGTPVPIPVVVTATLALEGDFSTAAGARRQVDLVAEQLRNNAAKELESTKIYIGGPVTEVKVVNPGTGYTSAPTVKLTGGVNPLGGKDAVAVADLTCTGCGISTIKVTDGGTGYITPPQVEISGGGGSGASATAVLSPNANITAVMNDAIERLYAAVKPSTKTIVDLICSRILQWIGAGGDPDDPVGVSLTALIPVDDTVVNALDLASGDAGFAKAAGLDDQFLKLRTDDVGFGPVKIPMPWYKSDITVGFRTIIQTRYGLLVPPESLKKNEGKSPDQMTPQSWETIYNGLWADNGWAKYVVGTQAWPQITWRP